MMDYFDTALCILLPLLFLSGIYLVWQGGRLIKQGGTSWQPRITTPFFGGTKSSSSDDCAPPQPARPRSRRLFSKLCEH